MGRVPQTHTFARESFRTRPRFPAGPAPTHARSRRGLSVYLYFRLSQYNTTRNSKPPKTLLLTAVGSLIQPLSVTYSCMRKHYLESERHNTAQHTAHIASPLQLQLHEPRSMKHAQKFNRRIYDMIILRMTSCMHKK